MPKVNTNNRINYFQSLGRIIQHSNWMDQAVTSFSTPTFGSVYVSGDTEIGGNLYVYGNTSIFGSNIIEFEDNIIVINRNETSPGVTLGLAGFQVNRGTGLPYNILFRESDDTFRVGFDTSTVAVATRSDNPLSNGIMTWNDSTKQLDSVNSISLGIRFTSTENATSFSTGSISVNGGVNVQKDMYLGGKLNFINNSSIENVGGTSGIVVTSNDRISLNPTNDIYIPLNKAITFGTTANRIITDSLNNISISAGSNINLSPGVGRKVAIPNLIPLVFSTDLEKIYADDNNNLVFESSLDVRFNPSRQVLLPLNKPISFSNGNQKIFGNNLDDLSINAGNNILLNPAPNLDVVLNAGNGIKFSTDTRIWGNVSNDLHIRSSNLYITTGSLKFNELSKFYLGPISLSNTDGNIYVGNDSSGGGLKTPNLIGSNTTTGTLHVDGTTIINGNTTINGNLLVNGTSTTFNTEIQIIEDNLLVLNSGPASLADSGILMKRYSDGVSSTVGNIYAGLFYKEETDEITLGYTGSDPGAGPVLLTEYIPFRSSRITIENSVDSNGINSTGASLYTYGGATVSKNLFVGDNLQFGNTNSRVAFTNSRGVYSDGTSGLTIRGETLTLTGSATSGSTVGVTLNGTLNVSNSATISGTLTASSTTGTHVLGNLKLTPSGSGGSTDVQLDGSQSSTFNINSNGIVLNSDKTLGFLNFNILSTDGSLVVTSSQTSGNVQIETDLDVMGKSTFMDTVTLMDTLTLMDSSLELSSDVTTFTLQPTGGSLRVTSTRTNLDEMSIDFGVKMTNKDQSSVVQFTPGPGSTGSMLTANETVSTDFRGITKILNKTHLRVIDTNVTGSKFWYKINGLESSRFSLRINTTFEFVSNSTTNSFNHSFSGESSERIVVLGTSPYDYYIQVDRAAVKNIEVENFSFSSMSLSTSFIGENLPAGTVVYDTNVNAPDSKVYIGDLYSYGTDFKIGSARTVFGFNTTENAVGVKFERNKSGLSGETPLYTFNLPSQSGVTNSSQIKFGTSGPTENLVDGVIEHSGNFYRIVSYDSGIKVAVIEGSFDPLPALNDPVKIYGNAMVNVIYKESSDAFELVYSPNNTIEASHFVDLKMGGLTASRASTFPKITVNSTEVATGSSGSLIVSGGLLVNKNLVVQNGATVNDISFSNGTILSNNSLTISSLTGGISFSSNGNLTFLSQNSLYKGGSTLTIDNQSSYLDLLGRIRLWGDATSKTEINGTELLCGNDCKVNINNTVTITNTAPSSSRTTGSLVITGGASIGGTVNSTNSSIGGALTVSGGCGIGKDVFIGGNLSVDGNVSFMGTISTPSIVFNTGSFVNCTLATVVYSTLTRMSSRNTLIFCIEISPTEAFKTTEIQFNLPNRATVLSKRTDIYCQVSGWTDDTNLVSLFNVLGTGVSGTTRGIVKFESNSTNTHYLQISCIYE